MSHTPALKAYAFDVAVSFAGEDREFVGEIVRQITAANARVFCDSDFSAGIRGEELPGRLEQVYRKKTSHAAIFISKFYAEKMWTRYERRAILNGAHESSGIHIIAVRLDDTALPGLRSAIDCLDARWVGVTGVAEAILTKLGIIRTQPAGTLARVPRTEAESQLLLITRPTGWELLYFAARLLRERIMVEGKYRDFVMGYAPPTDETICIEEAPDFISRAVRHAMQRTRNLNRVISPAVQEEAFGRPGEDGDAEAIRHMAMRLSSIYEDLMDWTARVRGAAMPAEFAWAVELLADISGHTILAYREFVDSLVAQIDRLAEQIAMGKPMTPDLAVTFSIPEELVQAIRTELRRVTEVFGHRRYPDGSRAEQPGTGQFRPPLPAPRAPHIPPDNAVQPVQPGRPGMEGQFQDQGRRLHPVARSSLTAVDPVRACAGSRRNRPIRARPERYRIFWPGHPSGRPPAAKHRSDRRSGDRRRSRHPSRAGAHQPVP
jgi:hypothetical protein